MHSKTGAGQIYSGKKTDSCVLPWQRSPHMRRANRFDAPAVTLHTLMKYGNYSHMKAPARARAGARVRKTTTNMTFSQKMHAVINSPVRKHIFYAAREPQKQRRPSADPVEGGGVRGVKGPLIGNPIVPVVQWERPLSAGGERLHPSLRTLFFLATEKIFSPPRQPKKQETPQHKHISRPCGMPRKPQLVEKLVSCRWEVRNFEQSIMFTVYTLEMGEI